MCRIWRSFTSWPHEIHFFELEKTTKSRASLVDEEGGGKKNSAAGFRTRIGGVCPTAATPLGVRWFTEPRADGACDGEKGGLRLALSLVEGGKACEFSSITVTRFL